MESGAILFMHLMWIGDKAVHGWMVAKSANVHGDRLFRSAHAGNLGTILVQFVENSIDPGLSTH